MNCPLCERVPKNWGCLGIGFYQMGNGKVKAYGYACCSFCSERMSKANQEERDKLARRIDAYYEGAGLLK